MRYSAAANQRLKQVRRQYDNGRRRCWCEVVRKLRIEGTNLAECQDCYGVVTERQITDKGYWRPVSTLRGDGIWHRMSD